MHRSDAALSLRPDLTDPHLKSAMGCRVVAGLRARRVRQGVGLLAAAAVLWAGSSASAALIPRKLEAGVAYTAFENQFLRDSRAASGTVGTSSAFLDHRVLYHGPAGSEVYGFHGTGGGSASYGLVGSSVQVILNDYSDDQYTGTTIASSVAASTDIVKVDNAPPTGTLRFTVDLHGSVAGSNYTAIKPNMIFSMSSSDGVTSKSLLNLQSASLKFYPAGTFVTAEVPFVLGVPFNLSMQINTWIDVTQRPYTDPGPIVSGLYYQNTAAVKGVEVFDASGNLVPGAVVSGEGGNLYPVPEPAGPGLLGVAAVLLRKRRRA